MNMQQINVVISGSFDNLDSTQVRFLEEASRLGRVHLLLWSDALVESVNGYKPVFPQEERQYCLEALRFVDHVILIDAPLNPDELPMPIWDELHPAIWVVAASEDNPIKRMFCVSVGMGYQVIPQENLSVYPLRRFDALETPSGRKKILVTGCYDWLHSGHIRFFEQVSELGDLYVVVGSDENVRLLKGAEHPLFSQSERRYMVQAVRFVKAALISTGSGWMDAEPEIALIQPDIFAVNEDGDKLEKRQFCTEHGIEYVVLQRLPKPGLPRRESTLLRGF